MLDCSAGESKLSVRCVQTHARRKCCLESECRTSINSRLRPLPPRSLLQGLRLQQPHSSLAAAEAAAEAPPLAGKGTGDGPREEDDLEDGEEGERLGDLESPP